MNGLGMDGMRLNDKMWIYKITVKNPYQTRKKSRQYVRWKDDIVNQISILFRIEQETREWNRLDGSLASIESYNNKDLLYSSKFQITKYYKS